MVEPTTSTYIETLEVLADIESGVGNIYNLFSTNKSYQQFWKKISEEEHTHASLILGVLRIYKKEPVSLTNNLFFNKERLIASKQYLGRIHQYCAQQPITPTLSFTTALYLEGNALGEHQFERILTTEPQDKIIKVIQNLAKQDNRHLKTIESRITKDGIIIDKELFNKLELRNI
jgi:rubrerythrin